MKKLFTLVYLLSLISGIVTLNFSASATPQETKGIAAAAAWPSCPSCDGNKLQNPSFEEKKTNNNEPTNWTAVDEDTRPNESVALNRDAAYKVCDNTGATFFGKGYFYQDVNEILEGSIATLKIFGARHATNSGQKFELVFLNASGEAIGSPYTATISNIIDNSNTMVMYTIVTNAAPSGTAKIRVKGSMSGTDGWIKVDAACLTVKTCETCTNNKLGNPDFETTSVQSGVTLPTVWKTQKNNVNATLTTESSTLYKVCGDRGAAFSGNGYMYQEVAVAAGSKVTLTIWGARHETNNGQEFQLVFLDASNNVKGSVYKVAIDKDVDAAPWGLRKYTINVPFSPDGSTKVSIRANMTSGGGWIKLDQACLTVVEQCGCDGNKLANGSFEGGTASWTPSTSPAPTFTSELPSGASGCGVKFGVIAGQGSIYQIFDVAKGSKVDLIIWGATNDASKSQSFKITFYNGNTPLSANAQSVEVDAVFSTTLTQYTRNAVAPDNATKVRIEAVNASGTSATKLYIDGACLKITTDTPLPVTLTDFTATKEKSAALLTWATTAETNASVFEVQQSENGKAWNKIGTVQAMGESSTLARYHFTHDQPAGGDNFYRLKMIDLDNSYSYSRILILNFENTESVQIYPNPTTDYMKLTIGGSKIAKVQLYNTQGSMVLETKPDSSDVINLSHLKSGSYVVKIKQVNGLTSTRRVQIIK